MYYYDIYHKMHTRFRENEELYIVGYYSMEHGTTEQGDAAMDAVATILTPIEQKQNPSFHRTMTAVAHPASRTPATEEVFSNPKTWKLASPKTSKLR